MKSIQIAIAGKGVCIAGSSGKLAIALTSFRTKIISSNIKKWGLDNNYSISWYTVGDSVQKNNKSDIDFSEFKTDLDQFRDHVIENDFTHFLLILFLLLRWGLCIG